MGMGFVLTPHKLSLCILLQVYATPSPPFCPLPFSLRHRLAFFLLQASKSCDGFLEPTLEEFGMQLKATISDIGEVLAEQLGSRLLGFSAPEDLFTFVQGLKDILAPAPYTIPDGANDDEPWLLEQNSFLGQFLRRCILSFNVLSFEGTCRLLSELDAYRRPALAVSNENVVMKDAASQSDEDEDVEVNDEDDENGSSAHGTPNKTPRVGRTSRAFGVPLLPMEGSEDLEMQECSDLQDLEYPQRRNGGVRDGGFSFAFGDTSSRGEHLLESSFLRTSGQVEAFLKEQAASIEKGIATMSSTEAAAKFSLIEKLAPEMHRVHYLQYLNSLHYKDYPEAISSLHRYFDYSAGRGSGIGSAADSTVGRFQSGLLSLGSMHANFGHVTQALQALSETVRIAQQNNDDVCLAHALAALCHLLSEVGVSADANTVGVVEETGLDLGIGPPMSVQQQLLLLLRRCLKRASELKLPQLVAFSRLALAKFELKHVRKLPQIGGLRSFERLGTSPPDVCKTLRLSPYLLGESILSTGNATTRAGPGGFGSVMGSAQSSGRVGPTPEYSSKLAGTSHLLRAASWELYGSGPMVRASTLIHAYCYSKVASANDLCMSYVKLVQQLALHKGYSAALPALKRAAGRLPPRARASLRAVYLQLVHELALNRSNLKLAQVTCAELSALASPVLGVDMDVKIEASYRHAQTLLASGNYSEAASAARELFSLCYQYDMQLHVVRVLLLIANIHLRSGSSITGLPYALASLTLSQSLNLDLLRAEAMVTLAELWLVLGVDHAQRALKLLLKCLPLVLGHGGLSLRARTNFCLARCYLSDPNFSVVLQADCVLAPLEQSVEDYETLENTAQASEVYYLQAIVYDTLGQIAERDIAATNFQRCILGLKMESESHPATVALQIHEDSWFV